MEVGALGDHGDFFIRAFGITDADGVTRRALRRLGCHS